MGLPQSYHDAVPSPDSPRWKEAMDNEIQSLEESNTWSLEELPADRKAIGGRWVFTHKVARDGQVSRFKARFVAQGFRQVKGIDFSETFSPTVRMATVHSLMQSTMTGTCIRWM